VDAILRCSSPPTTCPRRTAETVGELDETAIFYMQTRGLDRPATVRVIVEGSSSPLISSSRRAAGRARAREGRHKLAAARDDIEA